MHLGCQFIMDTFKVTFRYHHHFCDIGQRSQYQICMFQHNFDGPYMTFEPVTLVPFERNLIEQDLMTVDQVRADGSET